MNVVKTILNWNVSDLCFGISSPYAIVILNSALKDWEDSNHVLKLWRRASLRLCVDGAANQFYTYFRKKTKKDCESLSAFNYSMNGELCNRPQLSSNSLTVKDIPLPHIISGDFDSADPDILDYFKKLGVRIISTPDQDKTDFTKSLYLLSEFVSKNDLSIEHIIVIGGINNSRFDHVIANLRTMSKIKHEISFPIIMICGESLFWFLEPGIHRIQVPREVLISQEASWCGYASFGDSVIVSTSGLKWDVEKKEVGFEHLISTSNTYSPSCNGTVSVECSGKLLWFMGWVPDSCPDK